MLSKKRGRGGELVAVNLQQLAARTSALSKSEVVERRGGRSIFKEFDPFSVKKDVEKFRPVVRDPYAVEQRKFRTLDSYAENVMNQIVVESVLRTHRDVLSFHELATRQAVAKDWMETRRSLERSFQIMRPELVAFPSSSASGRVDTPMRFGASTMDEPRPFSVNAVDRFGAFVEEQVHNGADDMGKDVEPLLAEAVNGLSGYPEEVLMDLKYIIQVISKLKGFGERSRRDDQAQILNFLEERYREYESLDRHTGFKRLFMILRSGRMELLSDFDSILHAEDGSKLKKLLEVREKIRRQDSAHAQHLRDYAKWCKEYETQFYRMSTHSDVYRRVCWHLAMNRQLDVTMSAEVENHVEDDIWLKLWYLEGIENDETMMAETRKMLKEALGRAPEFVADRLSYFGMLILLLFPKEGVINLLQGDEFYVEAVHFGLVLHWKGYIDGDEIAGVVRNYIWSYLKNNVNRGIAYASTIRDSRIRRRLIVEVLDYHMEREIGMLMDPEQNPLEFLSLQEQIEVLRMVAENLLVQNRLDECIQIYRRLEHQVKDSTMLWDIHEQLVQLLIRLLSNVVISGPRRAEMKGLAVEYLEESQQRFDSSSMQALPELLHMMDLFDFASSEDHVSVIQFVRAGTLTIIPTVKREVAEKVDLVRRLHPSLLQFIGDVLLVVMRSLAIVYSLEASPDIQRFSKVIVSFSAQIHDVIQPHIHSDLIALEMKLR